MLTFFFQVLPRAKELLKESDRFHREFNPESNILVIGIPNVGKSTLINVIRNRVFRVKGRATAVGARPGITRAVQTQIRISDDPLIYVLDTPGILMPNIKNMHMGMRLAACGKLTMNDLMLSPECRNFF